MRTTALILAVLLPGCCCLPECDLGNSAERRFQLTPAGGEVLFEEERPRVVLATNATLPVLVQDSDFLSDKPSKISSAASSNAKVVSIAGSDGDVISLRGESSGRARIDFEARADRRDQADSLDVEVLDANAGRLEGWCGHYGAWAGFPLVVGYEFWHRQEGELNRRVWGRDHFPIEPGELKPIAEASTAHAWVLQTPDREGPVELKMSIESVDARPASLTVDLKKPSPIQRIGLADDASGTFLHLSGEQRTVQRVRAFPITETGEMCGTAIPATLTSANDSCLVRAVGVAAFALTASSPYGLFEISYSEVGECVLELALLAGGVVLNVAETLTTRTYEGKTTPRTSGSSSRSSYDDDDGSYDDDDGPSFDIDDDD